MQMYREAEWITKELSKIQTRDKFKKSTVEHLSFVTLIACPLPVYSSFDQEPVSEFDLFAQDAQ